MKIVFLDAATIGKDVDLDIFKELGEFEVYQTTESREVTVRCQDAEVAITNKVKLSREMIEGLPSLKLVCVAATGVDNVDLKACSDCGIVVKNVKGYSTESVAQLTLAMALASSLKLEQQSQAGKNSWKDQEIFTNLENPFHDMSSLRWGIIGLGEIGKRVAALARCLGCEVVYYSTTGRNINADIGRVELNEALGSDIVSVHCPLNELTRDLINQNNVDFLKDNGVLVNVARGGIVNERAIVEKFKNSDIRLAFDVASVEPIQKDNPLLEIKDSPRLILTPHVAWSSIEARTRLIKGVCQNIKDWAQEARRKDP